jgi:LysR family glycine cleavage system transcriptional activator
MMKGTPTRSFPSLNAIHTFEVAARHLSFSAAAAELNVTQSAVSRQVIGLEHFLGFELFHRQRHSLELTERGKQYAAILTDVFQRIHQATDSLLDEERPTTLNVNVLPTFGMKWLVPRLNRFYTAHPGIDVRMVTSVRPVDFKAETVDVAIRIAPIRKSGKKTMPTDFDMTNDWTNVKSAPLITEMLLVVCSPKLLSSGPRLQQPGDLRGHNLLHTRKNAWSYWLDMMGVDDVAPKGTAAFEHYFVAIQAAIDGKGIALIPKIFIEDELKAGTLVSPFESSGLIGGSYHLLTQESAWNAPAVKRFRKWLMEEVKAGVL